MSDTQDSSGAVPTDTSAEALEASEKAWYDDLDMTTVVVAGFVSTIATVVIIAVVQGLFYQWQNDAIRNVSKVNYISPAQEIVDWQKESLEEGVLLGQLTDRVDGEMYYPNADKRVLISLDQAKEKVIQEMGSKSE